MVPLRRPLPAGRRRGEQPQAHACRWPAPFAQPREGRVRCLHVRRFAPSPPPRPRAGPSRLRGSSSFSAGRRRAFLVAPSPGSISAALTRHRRCQSLAALEGLGGHRPATLSVFLPPAPAQVARWMSSCTSGIIGIHWRRRSQRLRGQAHRRFSRGRSTRTRPGSSRLRQRHSAPSSRASRTRVRPLHMQRRNRRARRSLSGHAVPRGTRPHERVVRVGRGRAAPPADRLGSPPVSRSVWPVSSRFGGDSSSSAAGSLRAASATSTSWSRSERPGHLDASNASNIVSRRLARRHSGRQRRLEQPRRGLLTAPFGEADTSLHAQRLGASAGADQVRSRPGRASSLRQSIRSDREIRARPPDNVRRAWGWGRALGGRAPRTQPPQRPLRSRRGRPALDLEARPSSRRRRPRSRRGGPVRAGVRGFCQRPIRDAHSCSEAER